MDEVLRESRFLVALLLQLLLLPLPDMRRRDIGQNHYAQMSKQNDDLIILEISKNIGYFTISTLIINTRKIRNDCLAFDNYKKNETLLFEIE